MLLLNFITFNRIFIYLCRNFLRLDYLMLILIHLKKTLKSCLWFLMAVASCESMLANNITVSNAILTRRDVSAGVNNVANFSLIQFDLSWENAWRTTTPNSWDAAWVFAKFRLGTDDYLSAPGATNSGNTITVTSTAGLRVGMPVFVNSGTGSFPAGTVITAINNATTFTVSAAPTTLGGSAVVRAERIWEHCWLNNTGHNKGSIGSNASLQVGLQNETPGSNTFNATTNPGMGAYLYRSAAGSGSFSSTAAALRWNYGAQGIKDNDIVDIKVFAVEMVQVPQGSYEIQPDISTTSLLINGDGVNGSRNNTITDASTNAFTVTRVGNVAQGSFSPFCNTGGSAYFDGSGDYLTAPDNAAWAFGSGNFTVEAWYYPTGTSAQQVIVGQWSGVTGSTNLSWVLLTSNNSSMFLRAIVSINGSSVLFDLVSSSALTINAWNHVAFVRSGNTFQLYLNGAAATGGSTTSSSALFDATNALSIGATSGGTQTASGYISNVRIVKGTSLYTSSFTPSTTPLTAITNTSLLLNFENAAVTDATRQNDIETVDNTQVSTTQNRFGGSSIAFDGSGDFLTLSDANALDMGNNPFTWECWVFNNSAQSGVWRAIYSKRNSTSWYNGPILYISTANTLMLYETTNNSTWGINGLASGTAFPLNQWVHVAVTWDGSTYRIFQNGTQVASLALASPPAVNASNLYIGAEVGGANPLNGFIDDIRITKGAALYTSNFTVPTAPLSTDIPTNAFTISSEGQLTLGGSSAGNLQYRLPSVTVASDFNSTTTQTLPAAFPKGFSGFYCMKYEIVQNQWREFFNTLTSIQKTARDITDATGKNSDAIIFRNNLSWTSGDATLNSNTHGAVSCNYLNWMDGLAYADWAGLRPMTELEYEKAGRGTFNARGGEIASAAFCGSAPRLSPAQGITNAGAANETASNSAANAVFGNFAGVQGPIRAGAFARNPGTRSSAGASAYGIMELSGNLWEQVVTMGNSTGRTYTGALGDGLLSSAGHANVSTWPGFVSPAVTTATGSGRRGGSWEDTQDRLRLSDRLESNGAVSTRLRNNGFRAARTLPSLSPQ